MSKALPIKGVSWPVPAIHEDHNLINFQERTDPFASVCSGPVLDRPITFSKVATDGGSLQRSLSRYLKQEKPETRVSDEDQEKMKNIVAWMKTTRILATVSNILNVQYGAAHYRKTINPEGRVYAIMQIYNIRVEQGARPHERPLLEQLVDVFGRAIKSQSPMMGQSSVRAATPMTGRIWCIMDNSAVPDDLRHSSNVRLESKVVIEIEIGISHSKTGLSSSNLLKGIEIANLAECQSAQILSGGRVNQATADASSLG